MPEDHQKERPAGQWAEQQKQGMNKQETARASSERRPQLSEEEQRKLEQDVVRETAQEEEGDDRTLADVIGQIAYADGQE